MESLDFYSELSVIQLESENLLRQIKSETEGFYDKVETGFIKKNLYDGISDSIKEFLNALKNEKEPTSLFKKAHGFLNEIEQREFAARNIMESLERSDTPTKILKNFTDVGLIRKPPKNSLDTSSIRKEQMKFCYNFSFKTIKHLGSLGGRIVAESLRRVPELIKIKTSLSLLPPFVSFSCQLEDSIVFDNFLELVQDSIQETNSTITAGEQ